MKCPICGAILELRDHPLLPHFACLKHGRFCINWIDDPVNLKKGGKQL